MAFATQLKTMIKGELTSKNVLLVNASTIQIYSLMKDNLDFKAI